MHLLWRFIFVKIYCTDPVHAKFFGRILKIWTFAKSVIAHFKIPYNLCISGDRNFILRILIKF